MPEIASTNFVNLFQKALNSSGRISEADVKALETASKSIQNAGERAAANGVLTFVKHDRELDAFEVSPVKKALGVLTGNSTSRLPAALEKVLTHAVPVSNVKVKNYDLSFDFSKDGEAFPAKAIITLDKKAGADSILEVNPERLDIQSVLVNGKAVPFEMKDGRLHVKAPGATAIEVNYKVKPTIVSGSQADTAYGLIRDKYSGRMWTLTWPYNTGALFPSNSAPADGATAKVTVKVSGSSQVVASGNPGANGSFSSTHQAPAYAIAMYTAPKGFELGNAGSSKDGVAVSGYGVDDKVAASVRTGYRKTAVDALNFYSKWLGKYDYGNTLRLIEVSGGLGGMEHTSAVAIMLNSAVDPEDSKETAAHETAHHWFGDNVRIADWGDFWMSEGFTNYATYRFFRESEGEGKYMKLLDRSKGYVRDQLTDNPHALAAPPETDVNEIFDSIPYEMGPWMLRMMEAKLGTPKFDALLKDWFTSKRGKEVTTSEFVKFAKAKTGTDFTAFFKEWNSITSVPSFNADVKKSGSSVTVKLTNAKPVPSGIEIPLLLKGDGGKSKLVTVKPGQSLTIDAGFPVQSLDWDPERTVMADVR